MKRTDRERMILIPYENYKRLKQHSNNYKKELKLVKNKNINETESNAGDLTNEIKQSNSKYNIIKDHIEDTKTKPNTDIQHIESNKQVQQNKGQQKPNIPLPGIPDRIVKI